MKKEKYTTKKEYVEVSDEDIVKDFMEEFWDDWEPDDTIDNYEYFWDDYEDLTEEDKERIFSLIKIEVNKRLEEKKQEEVNLLKDRKNILDFLDDVLYYYSYSFEYLSNEEILDLIIENGNK